MSILRDHMTPEEAAKRLGRSYASVCRYVSTGLLAAVTDRGRLYIPREAVENFKPPPRGNPTFRRK